MNHHRRLPVIGLGLGLAAILTIIGASRNLPLGARQNQAARPLDIEPEELRPGLAAVYHSLVDNGATLSRIEPKPAFYLGRSSPHPRLPPGPFEVTWSGVLLVKEPEPLSFHAFVGGELTMEVDGIVVLQGRGTSETTQIGPKESLKRRPGYYRVTIRFRALPDVPARLQVFWESPLFAREPLPAWRLGHIAKELPLEAKHEDLAAQGRSAAQRLGCARCHASAFPGFAEPPLGPSFADVGRRIRRDWLLRWLDDPTRLRTDAHMPQLFAADRHGFVERWLVADALLAGGQAATHDAPTGDHRQGRLAFLSLGCAACHFVPDLPRAEQRDLDRVPLTGLGDRFGAADLAAFLANPRLRYPDGRMPQLPVTPEAARDIAAYLLLWSKPTTDAAAAPPTAEEIRDAVRRLGSRDAATLLRNKGCTACHSGLGQTLPLDVPIKTAAPRGCIAAKGTPHYTLGQDFRAALLAYLAVAEREKYPSPYAGRQRQLERAACVRCHQRDSDRPPPIEEIGSTLGGAFLQELPFQRTPRLTNLHQKYTQAHLATTVREGIAPLRGGRYSYRMPAFGSEADTLLQALAEADGELPVEAATPERQVEDPTVGTLHGPSLVGFQGYACISCHIWNGQQLSPTDPGNLGPDLIRTSGRLRRDWFDRFLDAPLRLAPNTPMPGIFHQGKKALLTEILDGDAARQKDALWSYFAQGKNASPPKAPPPFPVARPGANEAPLVAQIPIYLPDKTVVESLCLLTDNDDLLIYDLAAGAPHSFYVGGQILRNVQGRIRQFLAAGTAVGSLTAEPSLQLLGTEKPEAALERTLLGYDHLPDGVRLRWQVRFATGNISIAETLRLPRDGRRRLQRELQFAGVPEGRTLECHVRVPKDMKLTATATAGEVRSSALRRPGEPPQGGTANEDVLAITLMPTKERAVTAVLKYELPPARSAPAWENKPIADSTPVEGALERPGYKATAYPRPKTVTGEDRLMPAALAVHPKDGRVFVASLKTGELFLLHDPSDDAKQARFENYGHGLFADTLAMLAEEDGLYVLHRRNFTKIMETKGNGAADRFERVAALPQRVADGYDYGYGLVRDKTGSFVFSYAQYGDAKLPGAGSALRFTPGQAPKEVAFGFRNPLGWCVGPEGEIFFTDNQGEWVATNKLCHVVEGRYYGYPNQAQLQHRDKPAGKTAVWVPYGWARSINGVAYDNSGGKFGPFAGQFFLAELMFGGAIIRADVEKVNGEYQGACFPFWGKGLLGPVSLAFDPRGRLFVGGITEPGWMAQPDRGALFRIDFTGQMPFEMQSIHVRPEGFRIVFTAPVDKVTAANPASYHLEHYRYEYTGAYGSPELDRTSVAVKRVSVADDGQSVELTTAPLVKDRVFLITAGGLKSAKGESLVHPTGAYTLNAIPGD